MKEYIVHAPENNVLAVDEYTTFCGEPIEQLIRCKDCKFWRSFYHGPNSNLGTFSYMCMLTLYDRKDSDYCSYAKRKEN